MSKKRNIPIIRDLSPAEAKAEITQLVTRGPGLDYLDIANELNLDLGFTIQIVDELVREGAIRAELQPEMGSSPETIMPHGNSRLSGRRSDPV